MTSDTFRVVRLFAVSMMAFWTALGFNQALNGDWTCALPAFGAAFANIGWCHALGLEKLR